MDTIVDRIRALCQQKKTSITKIEEELGYANGTIGKWKLPNRKAPLEKVIEVAKRLETSTEYLLTGEEQKEKPLAQGGEPPKYNQLTPENRAMIDGLIEKLLKSQSDG